MARRDTQRQLRLFGVGDLGPPDEDGREAGSDSSNYERWEEVFLHLGRLLAEEGFEDHLAHRERGRGQPGDGQ